MLVVRHAHDLSPGLLYVLSLCLGYHQAPAIQGQDLVHDGGERLALPLAAVASGAIVPVTSVAAVPYGAADAMVAVLAVVAEDVAEVAVVVLVAASAGVLVKTTVMTAIWQQMQMREDTQLTLRQMVKLRVAVV